MRDEIREKDPDVWQRIVRRRNYIEQELGIPLKKEVLPLSEMNAYFRPFLLKQGWALRIKEERTKA